jgi:GTPase SAR1 family protein
MQPAALQYVANNLDWLKERVMPLVREGKYILFDLPGQVELFNMHDALRDIIKEITGPGWDLRVCTVHLVDSHLCADPSKYIAALMLSLSSMLHLETPHVNVLSKVDLMDKYGELDFNLEYYTDVMDLTYLADRILQGPVSGSGESGESGGASSSGGALQVESS